MSALGKLKKIFDRNIKLRLVILLIGIIIGASLEVLALSLISPLISILLNPEMVYDNAIIAWVYNFFGFSNTGGFLAFLTFVLAGVYLFRGLYSHMFNRIQFRFVATRRMSLSNRMLKKILGFSYVYHSNHNLAEMQRIILTDVSQLFQLVMSMLLMAKDMFMMTFMLIFLMIVSPVMTLFVIGLALICVLLYLKAFRGSIKTAGRSARTANIAMTKNVNQGLGGIKEVKMLRREGYFGNAFRKNSDVFVEAETRFLTLSAMPALIIEGVCFGGAFMILGISILLGADIANLVPQLSLFVLAAFRILPAISRQVSKYNQIVYLLPSVNAVYKSLFEENDACAISLNNPITPEITGHDILVKGVSYHYLNSNNDVLNDVNIIIPKNKSVAFVGPSGAGKTTLADLILGVLTPDCGGVYYNGYSIHHNFETWSKHIGYIPQQIYLLDESIIENVAFCIEHNEIDEKKVWQALKYAQLDDFVRSLPDGLMTVVGERGIRLSGGQRQRIGIARAMYQDPPILVLDEATSSLDNETEKAVMEAVMGFQGNKTLLIIAHRLSTIEHCDIVYRVENNTVIQEQ